jgi:hypothetical protein
MDERDWPTPQAFPPFVGETALGGWKNTTMTHFLNEPQNVYIQLHKCQMKISQTSQTVLWMRRLALTLAGGALCVCARSQSVTLHIAPAVHVTWQTTTNKAYQVEVSTNLPGGWAPAGELIEGTGGGVDAYFETSAAREFLRVQEAAASGLSWLEGVWEGTTYQASSNAVPFTARISIANTNRTFGAIYSNNTFSCSAELDLLAYSDTLAHFYSRIGSGPCLDGLLIITRVNTTNAFYNWYHTDGPTVASSFGVLIKRR